MADQYWVTREYGYTPLMQQPGKGIRIRDLSLNAVVDFHGVEENGYLNVGYGGKFGWMEAKYLEPYRMTLRTNMVDLDTLPTPDPYDLKQYVTWPEGGTKQTNFCGELCVALLLGLPLRTVLMEWKAKNLTLYQRIFGVGKATGTGPQDLIDLFKIFGRVALSLANVMDCYTPQKVNGMQLITSCTMNPGRGGRLCSRGEKGAALHWVSPLTVMDERCGYGGMTLYNSAWNGEEFYSWQEYKRFSNSPYGVLLMP